MNDIQKLKSQYPQKILDGKKLAEEFMHKLKAEVSGLKANGVQPHFKIMLIGEDERSEAYVNQKLKYSQELGIECEVVRFAEAAVNTEMLREVIRGFNADVNVHGILIQMPLPDFLDKNLIIETIDPGKDVDGLTAFNAGKFFLYGDFSGLLPCTPLGVMQFIEKYRIDVVGKEVVVVGRSNIAGKPMAMMFLEKGATVTICHSKTENLEMHTKRADILIVAVGKPLFITREMVKQEAVVFDIGITKVESEGGKIIVGDVDFENVIEKAALISPVPGGCGKMTVACLMRNVVEASRKFSQT